jgi:Tfp pilus assembly protein FimT
MRARAEACPRACARRQDRRARETRAAGFTLLELTLVLVLIGMTMALVAPSLRGFAESHRAGDLAMRVLSMTEWARSNASAQGQVTRLNVDPQGGSCWLTVQRGGAFVAHEDDVAQPLEMPDGSSVALRWDSTSSTSSSPTPGSGEAYIQFYPTGRCDIATLTVTGANGEAFVMSCDSPTEPYRILTEQEAAKR